MAELILRDEVFAVVGAAMEVYWQLGNGFLEPVYQEALGFELERRNIPHQRESRLTVHYKGHPLKKQYVADFVCYEQIVVELKALHSLSGRELAQLLNYLKVTKMRVGLVFNFGSQSRLEWRKLVL